MTLEKKVMSRLILEALIEAANKDIGNINEVGTPDLEAVADFIAEYIVKKGFWMEG